MTENLRLPVSLGKMSALAARMEKLGVFEADLDESFIRSGGKGGQKCEQGFDRGQAFA